MLPFANFLWPLSWFDEGLLLAVATGNMLQIIEAHLNWPVDAKVFEHTPPRLAS